VERKKLKILYPDSVGFTPILSKLVRWRPDAEGRMSVCGLPRFMQLWFAWVLQRVQQWFVPFFICPLDSLAPAHSVLADLWLRPDSFRRFPSGSSALLFSAMFITWMSTR